MDSGNGRTKIVVNVVEEVRKILKVKRDYCRNYEGANVEMVGSHYTNARGGNAKRNTGRNRRPRSRQKEEVACDIGRMNINDWTEITRDRIKWRAIRKQNMGLLGLQSIDFYSSN